jgi:hypothetical protein
MESPGILQNAGGARRAQLFGVVVDLLSAAAGALSPVLPLDPVLLSLAAEDVWLDEADAPWERLSVL